MQAVILIMEEVGPLVPAVVLETLAIKEEEETSMVVDGSREEAEEVSMEGVGVTGTEGEAASKYHSRGQFLSHMIR